MRPFCQDESYWGSLTAEAREQCVNRAVSRKLCNYEAFEPAGQMRKKWITELYPHVCNILNNSRTTIFEHPGLEVTYAVHLYMIERKAEIWPTFVTVCSNIKVGKEVGKIIKQQMKYQKIGWKYLVFKSFLFLTGDLSQTNNSCGLPIDISHSSVANVPPGDVLRITSTMGGCILVGNEAFGLTSAHPLTGAAPVPQEEVNIPDEVVWLSDSDEGTELQDREFPELNNMVAEYKRWDRHVPDNHPSIWKLSLLKLRDDVTLEKFRSMLPSTSSLFFAEVSTTPQYSGGATDPSRPQAGFAWFSDAGEAVLNKILLDVIDDRYEAELEDSSSTETEHLLARQRIVLHEFSVSGHELSLETFGWDKHGEFDKTLRLLVEKSSLILQQSNLEDDWLLVPLKWRSSMLCNVIPLSNSKDKPFIVKGLAEGNIIDQEVNLCLGISAPRRTMLRTTATGLYLPSAKRVIDVYTCDQETVAGDSGSWVVDDKGNAIGSILATCNTSYIIPLTATILSIKHHNPGLTVTFPQGDSANKPEPRSTAVDPPVWNTQIYHEGKRIREMTTAVPVEALNQQDCSHEFEGQSELSRPNDQEFTNEDMARFAAILEEATTGPRLLGSRSHDLGPPPQTLPEARHGVHSRTLYKAVQCNEDKLVQILVEARSNIDVNIQHGQHGSALQIVSALGREKVAQTLVDLGADINTTAGRYGSALYLASKHGHEKVVQLLINAGADINSLGSSDASALYIASRKDHLHVVQLLVKAGVDVNAQGGPYGSALLAAAAHNSITAVKALIDAGADINRQAEICGNALYIASESCYEVIVQMLVEAGADLNVPGGHHNSAIQAASLFGYENIIQVLVKGGADVNVQGGHYGTALQAASWRGYAHIVQMLVDNGANVNAEGGYYGSALQAAVVGGHEKVMQILIAAKADVNIQGGHYGTALQAASWRGRIKNVQLLLDSGADVNAAGGHYGNAIQAAATRGNKEVIKMLIEAGARDAPTK